MAVQTLSTRCQMLFQRFYDKPLAQASYLLGCQRTGNAIVVDPNRDVEQYLDAAAAEGLRVTHVTETHIHADFVSGARELAHRSGARLLLSDEGDAAWKYHFAAQARARLLHDGDHFMVGNIRIDVMHTPGHTPEHLSFLVTDTPAAAGAWGILTGDFVFVGDVGRPDLLERAAAQAGTMEASARTLFHSLERFRTLPDHLQLWPGHGAGSACGKALGAIASSTVGYEKLANWAMSATDDGAFIQTVLNGQPEPPSYFAAMKRMNRDGPPMRARAAVPKTLAPDALPALLECGVVIVDTRSAERFAQSHLQGTINIPVNNSFTTWAGWLLPYDADIYLLIDDACSDCAERAVRDLAMIGLDRVAGIFGEQASQACIASGHAAGRVEHISPAALDMMRATEMVTVLDVRADSEWRSGHLRGAVNIPLGQLPTRWHELPMHIPLVVHCQSGARSAIAASVLQSHGLTNVIDLDGGLNAWRAAALPVDQEA